MQQNAAMYSNAHVWMQTFDCCYTVGIHRNEMVANEAADECCMGRHLNSDLFDDYTQTFRDKYSLQQTIQVQTAEGPTDNRACRRDLDDSLKKLCITNTNQASQTKIHRMTRCSHSGSSHTIMRCGLHHQFQNHTRGASSNT